MSTDTQIPEASTDSGGKKSRAFNTAALSLAALGIVFGDIGTSPLYVMQVSLAAAAGKVAPTSEHVYGILSLIAWSMFLVVSVKYMFIVMRMDFRGEGGVLSLVSRGLAQRPSRLMRMVLIVLGIIGAGLLLGDGIVTPAISVLSALENVGHQNEAFTHWVLPATIAILITLFALQRFGTGKIGMLFGPIMAIWFLSIGFFGLLAIIKTPEVLAAFDPRYAIKVLTTWGFIAPAMVGAVVLCITGAESLFADLGHFGRWPIRIAWLGFVWPMLMLAYFGQGAAVLADPSVASHPFLAVVPMSLRIPMIVLSTAAAIIASQAVITGLFSISRQAIQLNLLPAVRVLHTSVTHEGRIYVPFANKLIGIGSVFLVIVFQSADALADAYGIAVTSLMLTTTIMILLVNGRWRARNLLIVLPILPFLFIDLGFVLSTILKVISGGWVPLLVALVAFIVMGTWQQGRRRMMVVGRPFSSQARFAKSLDSRGIIRTQGTGAFLSGGTVGVPRYIDQYVRHTQVLPERVVLITLVPLPVANVPISRRTAATQLSHGFWRIRCRYGYLDEPDIPRVLEEASRHGLDIDLDKVVYFTRRWEVLVNGKSGIAKWRSRIYAFCYRNSLSASVLFDMPADRIVVVDSLIEF